MVVGCHLGTKIVKINNNLTWWLPTTILIIYSIFLDISFKDNYNSFPDLNVAGNIDGRIVGTFLENKTFKRKFDFRTGWFLG